MSRDPFHMPEQGVPKDDIFKEMKALKEKDANWKSGKVFSLVYFAGEDILEVIREAHAMFMSENGLNPGAFPSLKKFEAEVLAMAAGMFQGDEDVVGSMTSGGTESILLAVKAARERALAMNPDLKNPEVILPITAHPAFDKACHYFGLKTVHTPVNDDFRADIAAFKRAFTKRTVLAVGSAPSYPQGVIDPIREMASLAMERDIPFHVDSCIGGFMLPFMRLQGMPVRDFDFSVPGVTSISADIHKYGYAAKGASVVLYRNHSYRKHQYYVYTDWPGGIYPSPTVMGTRPGGSIAAAWAVMKYLGEDGYKRIVGEVMGATQKMIKGVEAIDGIHVLSDPDMSIFAIASDELDIYAVGDEMTIKGWHMDRQQFPASLHVTCNHGHVQSADQFISDLEDAVARAKKLTLHKVTSKVTVSVAKGLAKLLPEKVFSQVVSASSGPKGSEIPKRTSAMYGMIGSLPNRGDIKDMVLDFMDSTYRVERDGKKKK